MVFLGGLRSWAVCSGCVGLTQGGWELGLGVMVDRYSGFKKRVTNLKPLPVKVIG